MSDDNLLIKSIFFVALAGALGAVARYLVVIFSEWRDLSPWGTMSVNILGCFVVGLIVAQFGEAEWFRSYGRALLIFGFLGAFTTFSAFSMDTFQLVQSGKFALALTYAATTVIGCLIATWVGYRLVQN